jgi:hypothetical protein
MDRKKPILLRRAVCTIGDQCPAVEQVEGGGFYVTGKIVNGRTLPEDEATVEVPGSVLSELANLEIRDWSSWLKKHRKTPGDLLRIQTLDRYGVVSDDEDFQRYVGGAPAPQSPYREPWFKQLRDERAAGQVRRNLHVVRTPLNDYLRYAFEWGYAYNVQHGQDVRILDVAEHPPAKWLFRAGDYWVVEHQHVVLCHYSPEGVPQGLVEVDAAGAVGFISAAEMAWELGPSFAEWWASHPKYHRKSIGG